jgi:phage head maturation protease
MLLMEKENPTYSEERREVKNRDWDQNITSFFIRKRLLSQQAEVSLITWPMYYKGLFPAFCHSAATRQLDNWTAKP